MEIHEFKSISNFLNYTPTPKRKGNPRSDLLKEIFAIYILPSEKIHRKKANWKRYVSWLKENHLKDNKDLQNQFKKNKRFIKEHKESSMIYFLSHIPTKDLHYITSVMKDFRNRGTSASAWLLSAIR